MHKKIKSMVIVKSTGRLLIFAGICLCVFFLSHQPINGMHEKEKTILYYPKKIALYFFLQQTLGHATTVLDSIHNRYGLNYDWLQGKPYIKFFKQPSVITCLYNIESTHSLEPILFLWQSADVLVEPDFLYEYALLLFLIYKDVLVYLASCMHQQQLVKQWMIMDLLAKTIELYNRIESLPLQEIIVMINLLTEEVPHIIQEYVGQPSASWYDWFAGHWWNLPVAIVTLVLKIMIIFKEGQSSASLNHSYTHSMHYADPVAIAPEDILRK